jgi:hypothetical protein
MNVTTLHRLLPDNDLSWALFPAFRQRVEAFILKNIPSTDPASVLYDLTNKWVSLPKTTGFWLGLYKDKVVAHCASWILESYGKPFVFIYQTECDDDYSLGGIQDPGMAEMAAWVNELNAIIPEGRPKIDRAEMATWRKAEVWARYFKSVGLRAVKVRSVIEIPLGSAASERLV